MLKCTNSHLYLCYMFRVQDIAVSVNCIHGIANLSCNMLGLRSNLGIKYKKLKKKEFSYNISIIYAFRTSNNHLSKATESHFQALRFTTTTMTPVLHFSNTFKTTPQYRTGKTKPFYVRQHQTGVTVRTGRCSECGAVICGECGALCVDQ